MFRYALALGDVDPYALADEVLVPLQIAQGGDHDRPASDDGRPLPRDHEPLARSGSLLTVEGAEVSAILRTGTGLRVRVFNPTAAETTVRIHGRGGWLVDLRDRPLEPFEGDFRLRPWGLATVAVSEP
jgi:hypothetical protein